MIKLTPEGVVGMSGLPGSSGRAFRFEEIVTSLAAAAEVFVGAEW
jgi:hypothetical protein